MLPFTPDERTTIEQAINRAEKETSGEIVVVIATASAAPAPPPVSAWARWHAHAVG